MEALSVPFIRRTWTDAYDAQITLRGVLRTEPDGLELEFRRSENTFGHRPAREDEIRTVAIPWADVQSLAYRRWMVFGGALMLRTRTLRALEGVPHAQGNEVTLPVARADRMAARELAATVELALAEQRIQALDAPASRTALPPG